MEVTEAVVFAFVSFVLEEPSHSILSYFGHVQNSSLQRQKNTKQRILTHKGTRMVEDRKD